MLKPGETAMIIMLDIDGNVVDVYYRDAKKRADSIPVPDGNIKETKLQGCPVAAYTTNPQRCVTIQTPQGPRTV